MKYWSLLSKTLTMERGSVTLSSLDHSDVRWLTEPRSGQVVRFVAPMRDQSWNEMLGLSRQRASERGQPFPLEPERKNSRTKLPALLSSIINLQS